MLSRPYYCGIIFRIAKQVFFTFVISVVVGHRPMLLFIAFLIACGLLPLVSKDAQVTHVTLVGLVDQHLTPRKHKLIVLQQSIVARTKYQLTTKWIDWSLL